MKKYIALVVAVIVILLLIVFRNRITALFSKSTEENTKPSTQTQQPVQLDYNKSLFKGVQDAKPEVKKLQEMLGVTSDGDFGPQTEAALKARKGVLQTTLNFYMALADLENGASGEWDEEDGTGTSFLESFPSMFNNGVNGAFNWITG